jgi:hypothetical protein
MAATMASPLVVKRGAICLVMASTGHWLSAFTFICDGSAFHKPAPYPKRKSNGFAFRKFGSLFHTLGVSGHARQRWIVNFPALADEDVEPAFPTPGCP